MVNSVKQASAQLIFKSVNVYGSEMKVCDGVFPQNRFGELNTACYGYIYQPATDSGED